MPLPRLVDNQRGIALITVMLVALAVSSIAIAASLMTLNGTLVRRYSERTTMADHAALSGLQEGFSAVLGYESLYPQTGYTTLEDSVQILDASGNPIPGVWRSTYVGPSLDPAVGTIVSEVWGQGGVRAVRRLDIVANSFASYGTYVNDNLGGPPFVPSHDQHGPVHFNDDIMIASPVGGDSAIFYQDVTTSGNVVNGGNGVFRQGYTESTVVVPMPSLHLDGLAALAYTAGLRFNSTSLGSISASLRLEFIPVDMDGDSLTTDDIEGFVRVYYHSGDDRAHVSAIEQGGSLLNTPNCGVPDFGTFRSFANGAYTEAEAENRVDNNQYKCFLGGDPALDGYNFTPVDTLSPGGAWLVWGGAAVPGLGSLRGAPPGQAVGAVGYDDAAYLHPYTSGVNANATGVIYVNGDVAVNGVVAGKVTLVAGDDIIIVDDIVQLSDPGLFACNRDLLGLIASDDVVVADNTLNTPQRYGGGGAGDTYHTMSATKDEFVQAVIMAYGEFRVHNAFLGPNWADNGGDGAEPCENVAWGRGCLYITGGIIQYYRGHLGGEGSGHKLRQSYNACVQQGAPPHFPTDGTFSKRHTLEIDGANFDVATWFADYQS